MTHYRFDRKTGMDPTEVWEEVLEDIVENRVEAMGLSPEAVRTEICSLVTKGGLRKI